MRKATQFHDGRLLLDGPASGVWNMAVDEALLLSATKNRMATLRFYSWNKPTLSLGYFQPHRDRRLHTASLQCPLVRRSSGGGAIVHDRELTYSLTLPVDGGSASETRQLYTTIHQSLADALAELGLTCNLCCLCDRHDPDKQPFLCFQRRSSGDLLWQGAKIAGSAQRRHKGAILQHGSVLLDTSPFATELLGIATIAHVTIKAENLIPSWICCLQKRLGGRWTTGSLSDDESEQASGLVTGKFARADWTTRR